LISTIVGVPRRGPPELWRRGLLDLCDAGPGIAGLLWSPRTSCRWHAVGIWVGLRSEGVSLVPEQACGGRGVRCVLLCFSHSVVRCSWQLFSW
jgi:hypothetical protein